MPINTSNSNLPASHRPSVGLGAGNVESAAGSGLPQPAADQSDDHSIAKPPALKWPSSPSARESQLRAAAQPPVMQPRTDDEMAAVDGMFALAQAQLPGPLAIDEKLQAAAEHLQKWVANQSGLAPITIDQAKQVLLFEKSLRSVVARIKCGVQDLSLWITKLPALQTKTIDEADRICDLLQPIVKCAQQAGLKNIPTSSAEKLQRWVASQSALDPITMDQAKQLCEVIKAMDPRRGGDRLICFPRVAKHALLSQQSQQITTHEARQVVSLHESISPHLKGWRRLGAPTSPAQESQLRAAVQPLAIQPRNIDAIGAAILRQSATVPHEQGRHQGTPISLAPGQAQAEFREYATRNRQPARGERIHELNHRPQSRSQGQESTRTSNTPTRVSGPVIGDQLRSMLLSQWHTWATQAPHGEENGRKTAVYRMKAILNNESRLPTRLNLENLGLKSLPQNYPPTVTGLQINKNPGIRFLHPFPEGLMYLRMKYCHLTELPSNLPNSLRLIDVKGNQIAELPRNLPTSLQELYLAGNPLSVESVLLAKSVRKTDVS